MSNDNEKLECNKLVVPLPFMYVYDYIHACISLFFLSKVNEIMF